MNIRLITHPNLKFFGSSEKFEHTFRERDNIEVLSGMAQI
jgi:hypothetical protein